MAMAGKLRVGAMILKIRINSPEDPLDFIREIQGSQKLWRAARTELMGRPFEYAASQEGEGNPLVTRLLSSRNHPDTVKTTVGSLYAAGTDTTTVALKSFLVAMMLFPKAQRGVRLGGNQRCHGIGTCTDPRGYFGWYDISPVMKIQTPNTPAQDTSSRTIHLLLPISD
ncbi:uncharacterized protein EI90DRAFT_3015048 [Cantharellus anzutake]|uniref:uncharacterized protein n=1 Tax=Cantharellus anzutake TaxID=1750568 RepID=UPI001905C332|nr:uncharacterized protein EI90DRAFT_3015048 [Cantharellus anzutake]KAF8333968.1 hypothetical protein EI90DRAFT_3015048 [Cantharellus anzutake]